MMTFNATRDCRDWPIEIVDTEGNPQTAIVRGTESHFKTVCSFKQQVEKLGWRFFIDGIGLGSTYIIFPKGSAILVPFFDLLEILQALGAPKYDGATKAKIKGSWYPVHSTVSYFERNSCYSYYINDRWVKETDIEEVR